MSTSSPGLAGEHLTAPGRGSGGQVDPLPPARLRTFLSYLGEHRRVLAVVLAVSILASLATLVQPVLVNTVIDSVAAGRSSRTPVLLLVAALAVAGALGVVQQYLLERTAEGVVRTARRRLLRSLLRLPVREYDSRRTGDLISRMSSDTAVVQAGLTGGLVDVLSGALVLVGSIVAMALLDPLLLGLTLLVVLVAVGSVVLASTQVQRLTTESQAAVGRLASGTQRALSGIRTIRASNATEREEAVLLQDVDGAYQLGVRIAGVQALLWPVSGLAINVAFLLVLGVGGLRVASGALAVGELVSFIRFLFMMLLPLGTAFSAVLTIRTALGALARIEEILRLETEDVHATSGSAFGSPAGAETYLLALQGVSFSYGDRPVLEDVYFGVPRGATTALVGPSGSGKSTVCALIERFYEPDSGWILLDGRELDAVSKVELRSRVAYVEQAAPVLAGTVRANLTLSAPEADDARCHEVLTAVGLLDRVLAEPLGLDAVVGEDGVGLSGGEQQRLAIARALLSDAELLVLDEPTSSLDSRSEAAVREAVRAAGQRRTVLIVAHRLATVIDADQIVVLDGGRVSAVGTHAELLATNPLYGDLARQQLLG